MNTSCAPPSAMLKDAAGHDEVRLVIHDAEGQDTEFDLPRAGVSEDLARSLRHLLGNRGTVRLGGGPRTATAAGSEPRPGDPYFGVDRSRPPSAVPANDRARSLE